MGSDGLRFCAISREDCFAAATAASGVGNSSPSVSSAENLPVKWKKYRAMPAKYGGSRGGCQFYFRHALLFVKGLYQAEQRHLFMIAKRAEARQRWRQGICS